MTAAAAQAMMGTAFGNLADSVRTETPVIYTLKRNSTTSPSAIT